MSSPLTPPTTPTGLPAWVGLMEIEMSSPCFHLTHFGAVTHGIPPEGATIIACEGDAPFAGRFVLPDALAVVLTMHREWWRTRWDTVPTGRRATLAGASLDGANLVGANLVGATLVGATLDGANLDGAIGIATPEEEAVSLAGAVDAIAADPSLWRQDLWHGQGYDPSEAPAVGACGTAHCLAGHLQAQLPLGHPYRSLDASDAGARLAPRAAAAGWFRASVHPDLQARVDAAVAASAQVRS